MMKKMLTYGMTGLAFLLPWQTVWIIQEKIIGPEGAAGVWQYGTVRIYVVEFLVVALAILFFTMWCLKGSPSAAERNYWWRQRAISVFLLFTGLSIFWSDDRLVALLAWIRLLEGVFLFYLFRTVPLKRSWFLGAWIAAALVQSALGVWQFFAQEVIASTALGIAAHDPATLGTAVVEARDRRWLRAYGGFPHPNILGAYLSVSMLMCVQAIHAAQKKWQWLLVIGASQVILIALIMTFSRSAWFALSVAALCALVTLIVMHRKELQEFISPVIHPVVILVIVSAVTIAVFSTFFLDEMKARVGLAESRLEVQSVAERVGSYARAAPLLTRLWFTGTGIGNFTNTLFRFEEQKNSAQPWYTYQPIHNVSAMVFAELGSIGFILFAFAIIRLLRRMPARGYPLLTTLAVLSLFDHFLWTLVFGICMAALPLGIATRARA